MPATFSVPRAPAALLPAAVQQRLERDRAAHAEHADALGRAELVAGDAERVDAELRRRRASSQPAACTASVWNGTPRRAGDRARARAIGWTVPISLFA